MKSKYIPVIEKEHKTGDGIQKIYRFPNNYGASVVMFKILNGEYGSYTSNEKEWELAIIKFNSEDNEDFKLCYDTCITDDVEGHLSDEDVEEYLDKIKNLKKITKTPIQEIKIVKLQGVLMPNKEFLCNGKSLFLSDEEIEKYVEEQN